MISILGLVVISFGIGGLFWLDRNGVRVSKAIWIPFLWLLIASSRPISSWATFSTPGDWTDQYIDGSPLDRDALTFLLILGLFALSKRKRQLSAILRTNAPIIVFFLYCLISLIWADYPFVVFKRWIRSIGDVVMMLLIITDPNASEAIKRILVRIGYILIPLSILFIRFYPSLGRSYSTGGVPMWTGVATDKNALGALCMVVGIVFLWLGMALYQNRAEINRTRRLAVIGLVFGMTLYLLLVANSQTAMACFVLAGILILMTGFSRMFRRPALVSFVVAGMLIASFCVLFLGIGTGALTALGRNATLTGRTDVWTAVLPFATNPWLGAGYENFWIGERLKAIVRALGTGLNQAHNGYIEIYLNIGWVGIILLSAIIVAGYRNVLKTLRRDPEMGRLKLAFFVICLVYNCTEAAFKMMSPVWMLFLWASMNVPETPAPRDSAWHEPEATEDWGHLEPEVAASGDWFGGTAH